MEENRKLYEDKKHTSTLVREKSDVVFSEDSSNVILDTFLQQNGKGKKVLQKEYVDLSYEDIKRYSVLQSLLSQYVLVFAKEHLVYDGNKKTLLDNPILKGVQDIEVRILPLSVDKIYPASYLETKKEIAISTPTYVPTNHKLEERIGMEYGDIMGAILRLVQRKFDLLSDATGIATTDLYVANMKVVNKRNGVLSVVITDVAADMNLYIKHKANKKIADKLIQEKGPNLQHYLNTLPKQIIRIDKNFDDLPREYVKKKIAAALSKTISSDSH